MITGKSGVPAETGMTKELRKGAILISKVSFGEIRTQRAAPARTLYGVEVAAGRSAILERRLASNPPAAIFNFSGAGQFRIALISRFNIRAADGKIIQNVKIGRA